MHLKCGRQRQSKGNPNTHAFKHAFPEWVRVKDGLHREPFAVYAIMQSKACKESQSFLLYCEL